jgi:S-adenosylmethionine decarboxylase
MNNSKQQLLTDGSFGMELILDLSGCSPESVREKESIVGYAQELCKVIDMKAFGEPFVERFALDNKIAAGYSLVQLIETSSITAHFSEYWNKAYINIFSCKEFDPEAAAEFTKKHFSASEVKQTLLVR